MDFEKFLAQRSAEAQAEKDSPEVAAQKRAYMKQHGYPEGATLPSLMALWAKAKAAERLTLRAAHHNPQNKKNHRPSKAANRLVTQARIDVAEKARWVKNFLNERPELKPEFKVVRGNFFVGVSDFIKAEVGSPEEKDAMGLMMMAKRLACVLYPEQNMMEKTVDDEQLA